MEAPVSYKTIETLTTSIYKDKGSKFLGFAFPVHSEEEAKRNLEIYRKKYHDARHHCYAWVIGADRSLYRMNDDGEPSGTAGKPVMSQINSLNLTNVMVVVVRYFGGVLLGTGGLVRAYREAAFLALEKSSIVSKEVTQCFKILFNYADMNDIMTLLKKMNLKTNDQEFAEICTLLVEIPIRYSTSLVHQLERISSVQITLNPTADPLI